MNNNNSSNSSNFSKKLSNFGNRISNTTKQVSNAVTNRAAKLRNNTSNRFGKLQNNFQKATTSSNGTSVLGKMGNSFRSLSTSATQFAEANSTISKVVFLILMVILFGILLNVGLSLLVWLYMPSKNPVVIHGMRPTTKGKMYNVNPNEADPRPVLRSINEDQGMEFTWSTWFWMENIDYANSSTKKRIFSKGKSNDNNKPYLMNSPGIYAYPDDNAVDIVLSTFQQDNTSTELYETITIKNIPIKKWVHMVVRVQHNTVDVYLNGTLVDRRNMSVIPKQNYGNIFVGDSIDGMNGYISSLRYFSYAIGQGQIQDILYRGPNLKMEDEEYSDTNPPYLAMRWYFDHAAEQAET